MSKVFYFYLITALISTSSFSDSNYDFGGRCTSQGSWTRRALDLNASLTRKLKSLESNEHCQGISKILDLASGENANKFSVNINNHLQDQRARSAENVSGALDALSSEITSGQSISNNLYTALVGKTIESTLINSNNGGQFVENSRNTVNMGINLVESIISEIPKFRRCLFNAPDKTLSIMTSVSGLLASFLSSGDAPVGRTGTVMSGFVKLLQEDFIAKQISVIDRTSLLSSISCVIESTTANFCKAKDAYEVLDYVQNIEEVRNQSLNEERSSPLEGYFLLNREVPLISKWLQKVQLGVQPRLFTDGEYKSQIFDNINDLLQDIARLQGSFSDLKDQFENLNLKNSEDALLAKKAFALNIIEEISGRMHGGYGGGNKRGDANFFTRVKPSKLIPFFLIGMADIPDEVSGANKEDYKQISWQDWMQNGGRKFRPMFDNPKELIELVERRMGELIQLAQDAGGRYFQQRLIVDIPNLVDQSLEDTQITVFEALKRIYSYLGKMSVRMEENLTKSELAKTQIENWSYLTYLSPAVEDLPIYYNIQDTRKKIEKILKLYKQASQEIGKKIISKEESKQMSSRITEQLKALSKKYDAKYYGVNQDNTARSKKIERQLKKVDPALATRVSKYVRTQTSKFEDINEVKMAPAQELNEIVNNLLANDNIRKTYKDIIDAVYDEFNILYQRDTFMITRMSTFVKYDMAYYIKNKVEMSQYQKDLMTIAGTNLLSEYLGESLEVNPNRVKLDLDNAIRIQSQQINALEKVFGDTLISNLAELKRIENGQRTSSLHMELDRYSRLFSDSKSFNFNKLFYNLLHHKRRYQSAPWSFEKTEEVDNQYGSVKNLRAKLCIQTLAFRGKIDYKKYCDDTVLASYFGDKNPLLERKLNTAYNSELYKISRTLNQKLSQEDRISKEKAHYDNICALRDFDRKNYVYWLTTQFGR